ncbi:MAG: cytochrome c [Chloroflexota bacterium]
MQVKIVIGTIAFMLTMVILGYAALVEPARLEHFSEAAVARQIETGAEIYKNNCASCHGVEAAAQQCFSPSGEQIACQGLPLKNQRLVCGDRPERLDDMGWVGSKRDFVYVTVAAGRGRIMPTWSTDFGGALRNDQVENVTLYILNFEGEEFCSEPPAPNYEWPDTGNANADYEEFTAEWAAGDPDRGAELYNVNYGCAGCHGGDDSDASWAGTGPWLGAIQDNAPLRNPDLTTEAYIYESILWPSRFLVTGYTDGVMPQDFPNRMGLDPDVTPQDMQDIIAFLMSR